MVALITVGSVDCVLTSSQQLRSPFLLLPVLENTPVKKNTGEGLTGRQARSGETMEKPLARKLVNPPQVFSSTSFPPSGSSFGVLGGPGMSCGFLNTRLAP
jgi:hypothetical protein